jgi:hypothetical protein
MNRRFWSIVIGGILLIAAAWTIQAWRYSNPSLEWIEIDGGSYSTSIPSHWKPDIIRTSSGTAMMLSRATPGQRDRHALTINDLGVMNGPVMEEIERLRSREIEPTSMKRIHLANGIEAVTWSASRPLTVEIGEYYQTYVLLGTNRRLYSSTYSLSSFKRNWRSENLTRRILGSMKFKDAAPAKK